MTALIGSLDRIAQMLAERAVTQVCPVTAGGDRTL